ncbi:hypothetical protein B0A49_05277 [Cryomyces minteri]|uniref:Uncharacterized protein n=1 Tax=Cryomyces minteri TaxID=331657 RepID=A0A4U0X8M8_9PEZI|nr:hypothetical protein B0A49_05277 [Cryomyces minteri]
MPSSVRDTTCKPTVVVVQPSSSSAPSPPSPRVRFPSSSSLVTGISRPLTAPEAWSLYDFETHSQTCGACYDPYSVHRSGGQLCTRGHRLAQEVAAYVYRQDGEIYSTAAGVPHAQQRHKLVRVEIPPGFDNARGLLKAISSGLRHRSRRPILSVDRTYPIAPRLPARRVVVEQPARASDAGEGRRRHDHRAHRPEIEIVEWPATTPPRQGEEAPRRGSLYVADLREQQRARVGYRVEVREPERRERRRRGTGRYW